MYTSVTKVLESELLVYLNLTEPTCAIRFTLTYILYFTHISYQCEIFNTPLHAND